MMKKIICGIVIMFPAFIILCIGAYLLSLDGAPANLLVIYGVSGATILTYGGWLAATMVIDG